MYFSDYKQLIRHRSFAELTQTSLLQLATAQSLSSYYTPFEWMNPQAKVVLVGITPGRAQWERAIQAAQDALLQGLNDDSVLKYAKQQGAFSGPIRKNLVKILDYIGLQQKLDLQSTAQLFDDAQHLVHMTALMPHAIFKDNKNYSGTSPSMLKNAFLYDQIQQHFLPQIEILADALYIPLGQSVIDVLNHLSNLGYLKSEQILQGFPHPSGANAERILYFLDQKQREDLSRATDPIKIDQAKVKLMQQIQHIQF